MINDDMSFLAKGKVFKCSLPNTTPKSSLSIFEYHVSASKSDLLEQTTGLRCFKNSSLSFSEKSEIS